MTRLAIDIGGTFTDLILFNEKNGKLTAYKSLSTPSDPSNGVVNTINLSKIDTANISFFVHGGTTVINAITERKGVKTALITTLGFRDILGIMRGNRPDMYNLKPKKPTPFVERKLRFEVKERVTSEGKILTPLNLESLDEIIDICKKNKVESIAIQFLHSYLFTENEKKCSEYIKKKFPEVSITISSDITREWREFERANTAVLNAYVQPIVLKYFDNLEKKLNDLGINCGFTAMQSNGGTTSFNGAKRQPITLVESGPAAGVNGAVLVGNLTNKKNIIYFDVGGTTTKCALIENGKPKVTTEYKLEWTRFNPGYPIRVPVTDLVEIGAGGGSIAWFDSGGSLKVGPQSAGADPGPSSYNKGGIEPTITDAKLITGVINPKNFASGQFELKKKLAEKAINKIASVLGVDLITAASSIVRVAEANMINALKLVSIQRGYDPRDFVLVAGGGGGPMHACTLGKELGVSEIIVPPYPGYFSAWGMLATDQRSDFAITSLIRSENADINKILSIFNKLEEDAKNYFLSNNDLDKNIIDFEKRIDMRYLGQEHTVTVTVTEKEFDIEKILKIFHLEHKKAYTFSLDNTSIEFVTFRLSASSNSPKPKIKEISNNYKIDDSILEKREVNFGEDGLHKATVYNRNKLPTGIEIDGPLIVEEDSTVTMVLPNQKLTVDNFGFLRIK